MNLIYSRGFADYLTSLALGLTPGYVVFKYNLDHDLLWLIPVVMFISWIFSELIQALVGLAFKVGVCYVATVFILKLSPIPVPQIAGFVFQALASAICGAIWQAKSFQN